MNYLYSKASKYAASQSAELALSLIWSKTFRFSADFCKFSQKILLSRKKSAQNTCKWFGSPTSCMGFSRNTGYFRNQKTVYLKALLKLSSTDLIVVIFLYTQKDYSGDYQLQCYGMNTDNSWTSGGESGYCAVYPELYEGARQAIRFCPCH